MLTQKLIDRAEWDARYGGRIAKQGSITVIIRQVYSNKKQAKASDRIHFYRDNPFGGTIQTGRAKAELILLREDDIIPQKLIKML